MAIGCNSIAQLLQKFYYFLFGSIIADVVAGHCAVNTLQIKWFEFYLLDDFSEFKCIFFVSEIEHMLTLLSVIEFRLYRNLAFTPL